MTGAVRATVVFTFSYATYADAVSGHDASARPHPFQTLLASDRVEIAFSSPIPSAPFPACSQEATRPADRTARDVAEATGHAGATPTRRSTPARCYHRTYTMQDSVLRRAAGELDDLARGDHNRFQLVAAFSPFGMDIIGDLLRARRLAQLLGTAGVTGGIRGRLSTDPRIEVGLLAVSQQIVDRIAPRGPHAVVADRGGAVRVARTHARRTDWLARIPGPRAIYVGTIDDRLDVEVSRPSHEVAAASDHPARSGARSRLHRPLRRHRTSTSTLESGSRAGSALRSCDVALLAIVGPH